MRTRVLAVLAALLALTGCGSDDAAGPSASEGLRIASFDFAESELLAELYAQAIEGVGVPVVRVGAVGPREIVAPAMELDQIDLVPEYLGTARRFFGASEKIADTESARADLSDRLAARGLTALAASEAEDKNVFVVTSALAMQEGLESISDLADVAAGQRFGGPPECPDRPLCLAGLQDTYGLQFAEFVPQRSLEFTAEALRRREIDVGLMFSTASQLVAIDLVSLRDDRSLQPAENIVPVVRIDALEKWGDAVRARLDAVSAALTTEGLRTLNLRSANGEPVDVIARAWLADNGVLTAG